MAESEADTPSTPIEFESKYFEFDGVRLPPFCRGKMEDISNFSLRSSDIWIVTYPKSAEMGFRVHSQHFTVCRLFHNHLPASDSATDTAELVGVYMSSCAGCGLQSRQPQRN
ncbi:sulfotransferase 4A1-like, partial [Xiphophorus maculatus]|uniref:sulfotransferase 4A1-like n=1 Tax=Xiphophorus maculatus TaxID=8083 RepID=UPI000C6E3033